MKFKQVRQLLENYRKGQVIATCRNPTGAEGLLDLKKKHADRLTLACLDVTEERSIDVSFGLFSHLISIRVCLYERKPRASFCLDSGLAGS